MARVYLRIAVLLFLLIASVTAIASAASPPGDIIFRNAVYKLDIKDGFASLTGEYSMEVLSGEEWHTLAIGNKNSGIYKVYIDGKQAMLSEEGGWVTAVFKGRGSHRLKTCFLIPITQGTGQGSVEAPILTVLGAEIIINAPSNYENITIENAIITERNKTGGGASVKAILGAVNTLKVRYNMTSSTAERVTESKAPAKIYSSQEILISINDDMMTATAFFNYDIKHSAVGEFSITVPAEYEVADVTGASGLTWKVESGVLKVTPASRVSGAYQLRVELNARQPNMKDAILLPQITTVNSERESGFVAVDSITSLEVTSTEVKGIVPVDPTEIPDDIKKISKNPIVLAYRFSRHPYEVKVSVVRHEERHVLGAAIDSINAVSMITADGKSLTRVVFEIRNNNIQYLKLDLPENSDIWSAFLDDQPIKPVKNEKGQTLFPLKKAGITPNKVSFTLDIIYFAPMGQMLKSGKLNLVFPRTDIPASEMMATLYLPPKFKYYDFGGTMERLTEEPISLVQTTTSSITQDATTIMGKKTGLVNEEKQKIISITNSEFSNVRQKDLEREFAQDVRAAGFADGRMVARDHYQAVVSGEDQNILTPRSEAAHQAGILPVKFSVPLRGQFIRFTKLLVVKDAPTVTLNYKKNWFKMPWDKAFLAGKVIFSVLLALLLVSIIRWFWKGPRAGKKLLVASVMEKTAPPPIPGFPAPEPPATPAV